MATLISEAAVDGAGTGVAVSSQFATVTATGIDDNPGNVRIALQYSEDDVTYYDLHKVIQHDGAENVSILSGANYIRGNVIGMNDNPASTINATIQFNA